MNAVLYARYSSDMQREESIDAQLRAGREYCKGKEYFIIREYRDEAFSGTNDNRPGFQQMLSDAKDGLFNVVVFHKVDRHSRNEYDYYFSKLQLKKYGVRIEYVAQRIDDSPEGAMMEAMLVGMSAYYSRNLSKEIIKGKKENALKGMFNGGTPPLGYQVVDKKYVIDEYESQAVRLIFDMYLTGNGYNVIIDELNRRCFKTKRGAHFGKNSLHDVLRNVRYCGTYILGKTRPDASGKRNSHGKLRDDMVIIEDAVPAIISKADFAKVVEKMEKNRRRSAAYRATHNYLLSGLAYCGECGAAMHGKTTTSNNPYREHQYYLCGTQSRKGKSGCANKAVNLIVLENLIIQKLEDVLFTPSSIEKLVEKITAAYTKRMSTIKTEHAVLTKEKNKIERRMDMLYTQIEEGLADEYDMERLKKVKEEMNCVRVKLSALDNRAQPFLDREQVLAVIDSYRLAIKTKSADNLRALIENFINKVTISKDEIVIEFKINFFGISGAPE